MVSGAQPADGRRCICAIALALCSSGPLGCVREQLPEICPSVDVGELVISELRGPQTGDDSFGNYLEVYNAAGKTVDLEGMFVRVRSAGGDVREFFVRESVEVAANGYAVIGGKLVEEQPNWMDYAIGTDTSARFLDYKSAFVELEACDETIDEVFYATSTLPTLGTLACGNDQSPPSAEDNDDAEAGCWCTDAGEADGQPLFGVGLPGTPGGANRCP